MPLHFRHSLAFRIIVACGLLGAGLSAAFALAVFVATQVLEDTVVIDMLASEAGRFDGSESVDHEMPYRMHAQYLRRLFLNNDLAAGRYLVEGRPVALSDIDVPVFAVGTVTDHVAPWRSVYKLTLLLDSELTFLLTSGGHNAGIISPPGKAGRSYQVTTRGHDAAFVDPGRWQEETAHQAGSWWPAWEHWLARRAGPMVEATVLEDGLADAPGEYVRQP